MHYIPLATEQIVPAPNTFISLGLPKLLRKSAVERAAGELLPLFHQNNLRCNYAFCWRQSRTKPGLTVTRHLISHEIWRKHNYIFYNCQ
jgi:hypothetical protein